MKPSEMTAPALIAALGRVPDGTTLEKNAVGNLSVMREDAYIGFVDLRTGEVDIFEDESS